jgi:uncharacterized membrane protein
MKRCYLKSIPAVLFLFAVSMATVAPASGQSRFEVESMDVVVYRDGLVHVKQTLTVDEVYPEIFLSLLASSVENMLVLDEDQRAMDYQISGLNCTVFTLGAEQAVLDYDASVLTNKDAEVWTFLVDSPYNLSVSLPKNSTLIYLNQMPSGINTDDNGLSLSLFPGSWEISYVLPVLAPGEQDLDNYSSSSLLKTEYLIGAVAGAAVVVAVLFFFLVRRGRQPSIAKILKANPQLMDEDRDVLEFLVEKKGKAFEAEIRVRFPDMPRTSLWRLIRRLERLEIVEIKKIGLENQVQLKK